MNNIIEKIKSYKSNIEIFFTEEYRESSQNYNDTIYIDSIDEYTKDEWREGLLTEHPYSSEDLDLIIKELIMRGLIRG